MFYVKSKILFPPELEASLRTAIFADQDPSKTVEKKGAYLKKLWPKLAKQRGIKVEGQTHYSMIPEESEAYAAYYLPSNALKMPLILEESFLLGYRENTRIRWLDLGTGPGTAYWGLNWWASQRNHSLQFLGWDQSKLFAHWANSKSANNASFVADAKRDPVELVKEFKPTHISLLNSISEIFPDTSIRQGKIKALLLELQLLTKSDGLERNLLLVEPGTQTHSRELSMLKDALQHPVHLPCTDDRKCGALVREKDWCHEEVACEFPSWLNDLGDQAGLKKEALLFSYIWWKVGAEPKHKEGLSRIVSQRLERKGQVECWLCTGSGKKLIRAQRRSSSALSDLVFKGVRGDLWAGMKESEKGDLLEARVATADNLRSLFKVKI